MHQAIVITHILGSFGVMLMSVMSLFSLYMPRSAIHIQLSYALALNTCVQILTGSLLTIMSNNSNIYTFCTQIGTYTAIIFITQAMLFYKLKSNYPLAINTKAAAFSTISSIVTIVMISS